MRVIKSVKFKENPLSKELSSEKTLYLVRKMVENIFFRDGKEKIYFPH